MRIEADMSAAGTRSCGRNNRHDFDTRPPSSASLSTAPSLIQDMYVAERGGLDPVPADGATLGEVLLRGTKKHPPRGS